MDNIVHHLDPERVKESVNSQIESHKQRLQEAIEDKYNVFKNNPEGHKKSIESFAKSTTRFIEKELNYYSTVRVIELPSDKNKRFVLVYGDVDNQKVSSGTGPFESIEKAANWFYDQGR